MRTYSEVQRGIYSMESFCDEEFLSQSDFLTPKHIICLLEELSIVAPFYDRKAKVEKFFIPFVLNHLPQSPDNISCSLSIVQSLAVMFECGHCPKGIFGVLLQCVLTQKKKNLDWHLNIDKIFRDEVSFEVGPYEDVVTLKFHSTHLEVKCYPVEVSERNQAFTVKKICNIIRCTLVSGIEQATNSLRYSADKTKHALGLVCTHCKNCHSVIEVDSQPMVRCREQNEGYQPIPDAGFYWFGAPPIVSFPNLAEDNALSLKEGSNHSIEFLVTSDPSLDSQSGHFLSKNEGSLGKSRVSIIGKEIVLKKVSKSDAGIYTVTTYNVVGKGQASFQLNIRTPPKYFLETYYIEAIAGSSPTLAFTVTSDPPLAEDTQHSLSKRGEGVVIPRFKVEGNCITFHRVRVDDSGVYTISCCSEEGDVGVATLELYVTPTQLPPTSDMQGGINIGTITGGTNFFGPATGNQIVQGGNINCGDITKHSKSEGDDTIV